MAPKSTHEISLIFLAFVTITFFSIAASKEHVDRCSFKSIKDLCNVTLFPDSCQKSLAKSVIFFANATGADKLNVAFKQSAQLAINAVSKASLDFSQNGTIEKIISNKFPNNKLALSALQSCRTLLSLATDSLNDSISSSPKIPLSHGARNDIRTWLSAAGTDLQTCLDEFGEFVDVLRQVVHDTLDDAIKYTSNSLAIVTRADMCLGSTKKTDSKKFGFPYWLKSDETKRLLDMDTNKIIPNIVVALDGSGNYTRISDALTSVPDRSKDTFIIFVKKGVYNENVRVEKTKWNVMVVGDGSGETIVSGNLNHDDGTKTFNTATFAVFGKGFIARQMIFRNTAKKSQAVALLSSADQSVFYQCLMDSKQDTLYVHSKRQFYRECYILGTVDFIFGNAAVVIQTSLILTKNPFPGKTIVITAQSKSEPNQNTGISIQNCTILATEDLTGVRTFLGRPWRNFSTVVIMHSRMDESIDPKGWSPWDENPLPSTVFYGEYNNAGPGANTSGRVESAGVRAVLSREEAARFTVNYLIGGEQWLPKTGVPFALGF